MPSFSPLKKFFPYCPFYKKTKENIEKSLMKKYSELKKDISFLPLTIVFSLFFSFFTKRAKKILKNHILF